MLGGGNVTATLFPERGRQGNRRKSVGGGGGAGGAAAGRRLEPIRVRKPKAGRHAAPAHAPAAARERTRSRDRAAARQQQQQQQQQQEQQQQQQQQQQPKSPSVGLGVTLWLHRFIFKMNHSRPSLARKKEEEAAREPEKVATSSDPEGKNIITS